MRRLLLVAALLGTGLLGTGLAGCSGDPGAPAAEPSASLPQSPFGTVLSFSAAGPETVFAVTDARRSCPSCATLWRWTTADGAWTRVHDFAAPAKAGYDDGAGPFPPVHPGALAMAPDGEHGYFTWWTDGLLVTADGGRSWRPVASPYGPGRAQAPVVVAEEHAFMLTIGDCRADACPDQLWRAELGSDDWERLSLPEVAGEGAFELTSQGGVLDAVTVSPVRSTLLRSTDAGTSWTRVVTEQNPCPGCQGTCTAQSTGLRVAVSICLGGQGHTDVPRFSRAGGPWLDVLPSGRAAARDVTWVMAVEGDRSFLVGAPGVVLHVAPDRTVRRAAGITRSAYPPEKGFVTGRIGHLLEEGGRLLRTEDGGRTWRPIVDAAAG